MKFSQRTGAAALVPFLAIILSIAAFSALTYYALPTLTKKDIKSTNTTVNTNVANTTNTAVAANTNTSTDVTKDWKTYTNSKYNFSFKYPSNAIIEIDSADRIRIENYTATTENYRLKTQDFYLEVFIISNGNHEVSWCDGYVGDSNTTEFGSRSGLLGIGVMGGDSGGPRTAAACVIGSDYDFALQITEGSAPGIYGDNIVNTLTFTK